MKNIKGHIIFWSCYFLYAYITDLIFDPTNTTLATEFIFFFTANVYLFYSLYYFLRKFSAKSKYDLLLSIGRLVIILLVFFTIRHFIRYFLFAKYFDPTYADLPVHQWIVSGILWIGNYSLFAAGYFYFQSSIQKQKDLLKATEEKAAKEKEPQSWRTKHSAHKSIHIFYSTP